MPSNGIVYAGSNENHQDAHDAHDAHDYLESLYGHTEISESRPMDPFLRREDGRDRQSVSLQFLELQHTTCNI